MKLLIRILALFILLALIAASVIYIYLIRVTGDDGSSPLEAWIGLQIKGAAGSHLNVELNFEKPDYQYPYTVVLENIRLTAPDPAAGEGKTLDIISIAKATLTLGEIPAVGQPLHIERVILEKPQFNFVCKSATDAALVGFSNLIKTATDPNDPPPDPSLPPAKVTDVFRIRLVHITNGQINYDPRNADKRAMSLDRVNLALNVEPDKEGWYTLKTKMDRQPIGELEIDGRFNLNDNVLELAKLALTINLGGENNASLPPQMQGFLADHDVRGELSATVTGSISFADWRSANLDVKVNLAEGRFSFGQYRLNVPQLSVLASMKEQMISVDQLDARALGGTLTGNAQLVLNENFDTLVRLEGEDLRIHHMLKAAETVNGKPGADEELPFRGVANFKINARAPLTAITTRMLGGGNFTLREARLVELPGVSLLEDELGNRKLRPGEKRRPGAKDSVFLLFTFKNDRMRVDRFDYRSTLIAARGGGEVMLDGLKLNLIVNGGPLEKVQSLLGPIGDLTAVVTDRIAKYHITGVVGDAKIKPIFAEGIFDKIFGK